MKKQENNFGSLLNNLRLKSGLSLREICRKTGYDPSNWSKIERGVLSPTSDRKALQKWANVLGLEAKSKEYQNFIDEANIAQGIIPEDILARKDIVKSLPAFFRTMRNEKPTPLYFVKIVSKLNL
jgi:transcriptional regulator with XRE-family HTH domain